MTADPARQIEQAAKEAVEQMLNEPQRIVRIVKRLDILGRTAWITVEVDEPVPAKDAE